MEKAAHHHGVQSTVGKRFEVNVCCGEKASERVPRGPSALQTKCWNSRETRARGNPQLWKASGFSTARVDQRKVMSDELDSVNASEYVQFVRRANFMTTDGSCSQRDVTKFHFDGGSLQHNVSRVGTEESTAQGKMRR